MTDRIRNKPIMYSTIFAVVLFILWAVILNFARGALPSDEGLLPLIISAVTVGVGVFAVFLIGFVNQVNGFKFALGGKGFGRGLLALIPAIAFFVFTLGASAFVLEGMSIENMGEFIVIAVEQFTTSFMVNALFRGLLITSLFIKFSKNEGERVKSVFKASGMYLLVYVLLAVFNTGVLEVMQLLNTFIVGLGFCAAYMYSKNLWSLILAQGVWQAVGEGIVFFGVSGNVVVPPAAVIALWLILIAIVVCAVVISRRAEEFNSNATDSCSIVAQ